MNKERILYLLLIVLFVGYVVTEQYAPKPLDWTPTYSHLDKNPFGGYVLYDRLDDLFGEGKTISFQTLYEQEETAGQVIILASEFNPSREDVNALFRRIAEGSDVFIGAEYFSEQFLDTVGIEGIEIAIPNVPDILEQDSVTVFFEDQPFSYPYAVLKSHFQKIEKTGWKVHAQTNEPVLVSRTFGSGHLILSTVPLTFTNYGLLHHSNYHFAEQALRLLADGPVIYNRFYQSGKAEPRTPLRYLLSQDSLKWAVYLTVLGVLVLLIVGSQRKQRKIQPISLPQNSTVQFIKTIGGLYYREADHRGAAMKLIQYFFQNLKERYFLAEVDNELGYQLLAAKTGLEIRQVIDTFGMIHHVRNSSKISENDLKRLNHHINLFIS